MAEYIESFFCSSFQNVNSERIIKVGVHLPKLLEKDCVDVQYSVLCCCLLTIGNTTVQCTVVCTVVLLIDNRQHHSTVLQCCLLSYSWQKEYKAVCVV